MAKKKESVRRKVQEIIDGDTFKVSREINGSKFIRIAGENCPEKGKKGFQIAKARLSRKIKNKTITIRPRGKSFGRTVADVIVDRKILQGLCKDL